MTVAWDEPGWLETATDWIDRHVERSGPVELMLARLWSAVARVPTTDGEAWFKEDPPPLAFEPALTAALAQRRPGILPEVIAFEGPRLLTRDAGSRLRTRLDSGGRAPAWEELLIGHGELQLDLAPAACEALALGVLDARPERLEELSAGLPGHDRRREAIRRAVEGLGSAVPISVVHTEAHDGNLFIAANDHVRLLDWAEAVVSHPFVGMVLPLRFAAERAGSSPERLRDAYLKPFTGLAPLPELQESFSHGYTLGALVRALTWAALDAPPEASAELGEPVAAWLEIFDGIAARTITLGEA